MKKFKSLAFIFAVGGVLGTLFAGLLAPTMLGWYWKTPIDVGINCQPAVEWGISRFQTLQIGSVMVGGILNVILFTTIFRSKLPKTSV